MLALYGDLDECSAEFAVYNGMIAEPYDFVPSISILDSSALYMTITGCQFPNAPNCAADLIGRQISIGLSPATSIAIHFAANTAAYSMHEDYILPEVCLFHDHWQPNPRDVAVARALTCFDHEESHAVASAVCTHAIEAEWAAHVISAFNPWPKARNFIRADLTVTG